MRTCLRTLLAAALLAVLAGGALAAGSAPARTFRILHVMSYHASMSWSAGQLTGFKEAMGDAPVEYKIFEMDILRDRSPENLQRKSREARALIESWKPDLVYGSDDAAQEFVASHYVNTPLPLVFSGVNRDPRAYGMRGAPNVAGVIEHEHFVESLRLLRAIAPGARRVAAIFDSSPHWDVLRERMRTGFAAMPDVQVVAWDTIHTWEDYQRKIREYQSTADAIALVGFFDFSRSKPAVAHLDVAKWTAENSRLPDFALWENRVQSGTLAAVTVSDVEQGAAAGRMARAILMEGRSPASFEMKPTIKGVPVVSLARARKMGLKLTSSVLLSSKVVEAFEWDRR